MALILLCSLLLCVSALCESELHIKNAKDFIHFSKNVSSGTNYSETTVFLDADIDFSGGLSEQLNPLEISASIFKGHLTDKDIQSATLQ